MREVSWKLAAGKEVPNRLDGAEIRYALPESPAEFGAAVGKPGVSISVSGDDTGEVSKILTSVFNEGLELNHRQKPAKRAASRENSTVESIQKYLGEHLPGARSVGSGKPRESSKIRQERATMDELIAEMKKTDPEKAAAYESRMAALRAKSETPAAKSGPTPAQDATVTQAGSAAASAPAAKGATTQAPKAGAAQKK